MQPGAFPLAPERRAEGGGLDQAAVPRPPRRREATGRARVEWPTSTSASRRRRVSDTLRRLRLLEEAAGAPDELAVRVDLPFRAEGADHVPVQAGLVAAAEPLEARPEREAHRPADLLVEEDVAREPVDL